MIIKIILYSFITITASFQLFSQTHEFGVVTGVNHDIKGQTQHNIAYHAEYSSHLIYGLSYNYFLKRKLIAKSAYKASSFISTNVLLNKKGYGLSGLDNTVPIKISHRSYFMDINIHIQHHFFGRETFNRLNSNRFVLYGGIGLCSSINIINKEKSFFIDEIKETHSSNNLFGFSGKIDLGYRYKQFTILISPVYNHFFQPYSSYSTKNGRKINLLLSLKYKIKKVIKE